MIEALHRCFIDFEGEITPIVGEERHSRKSSEFTITLCFNSAVVMQDRDLVSPVFWARCDWLGNFDVDLYQVGEWRPLNRCALFGWWWHHLAILTIEAPKEDEAEKILIASGIKGANDQ